MTLLDFLILDEIISDIKLIEGGRLFRCEKIKYCDTLIYYNLTLHKQGFKMKGQ